MSVWPSCVNSPGSSTLSTGTIPSNKIFLVLFRQPFINVWSQSNNWIGVYGESQTYQGVHGTAKSSGYGVVGSCDGEGAGFWGMSKNGAGVYGESTKNAGVYGQSEEWCGVYRYSTIVSAVLEQGGRYALVARDEQFEATHFEGNVEVTGDIKLVKADYAEDFDVAGSENV